MEDTVKDRYASTQTKRAMATTLTPEEFQEYTLNRRRDDFDDLRFLLQETRYQMMKPLIAEPEESVPPAAFHAYLQDLQEDLGRSEWTFAAHTEKLLQKDMLDLSEQPYDGASQSDTLPVYHLGERGRYLVDEFNLDRLPTDSERY